MPTYQYACTAATCGHEFDAIQSFSDNALTECPECSGRLRKVWGSIGVVFKGSGFYRNDSRESASKGESKNGENKNGESKTGKDGAEARSGAKTTSESSASTAATSSSDSGAASKSSPAKSGSDASSSNKRKPAAATS